MELPLLEAKVDFSRLIMQSFQNNESKCHLHQTVGGFAVFSRDLFIRLTSSDAFFFCIFVPTCLLLFCKTVLKEKLIEATQEATNRSRTDCMASM